MIAILTALMLGVLHALEVDHMVAVTAFVADRPAAGTAARFGLRWGLGHSAAVVLIGGVLLGTGLRWPARYNAAGELVVGLMLAGLGAWALRAGRRLHLHRPESHGDHGHLHLHRGGTTAHEHGHGPGHGHGDRIHDAHNLHRGRGIAAVGLLHGLAGTSSVVALVPVTMLHRLDVGVGYLLAFGAGVTGGMVAFAVLAATALRQAADRSVMLGQRLTTLVGLSGVAVGGWWVWRAVS